MIPAKIARRITRRIIVRSIEFASLCVHRPVVRRRIDAERREHQVAEFAAELGDRPVRTIEEQELANRSLNRKRREARIDRREYAAANSFLDQRREKIEVALARRFYNPVARLGQARFFSRKEAQKVAPLIVELHRHRDRTAHPFDQRQLRIRAALLDPVRTVETVAQDSKIERILGWKIKIERALGDTRRLRDAVHRDRLVGLVREEFQSGAEDTLALGGLLDPHREALIVINAIISSSVIL